VNVHEAAFLRDDYQRCHGTNLQNLDVAAVKAGLGDEAALATGPHGQVDFGLVGTELHRQPRARRVSRRAAACLFNHAPKVLAVLLAQVLDSPADHHRGAH
jgi:hypothetical protein